MSVKEDGFDVAAASLRALARWAFDVASQEGSDSERKRDLLRLRRRLLENALDVERLEARQEASA